MRDKPRRTEARKSEILILPDGRILVQNLTQPMAEILRELNPRDRQIAPRARQNHFARSQQADQKVAGTFPPHPDPLPQGEGTAIGCADLAQASTANPAAGFVQPTVGNPPSSRGEGTAVGHFDKICKPASSLQPSHCQDAGIDSPSPWGEGRGEGGRCLSTEYKWIWLRKLAPHTRSSARNVGIFSPPINRRSHRA